MKQIAFVTSFALAAVAVSASAAFAYLPVTNFRCAADQLYGHPQDADQNGRTGYGRQLWSKNAFTNYKLNGAPTTAANYWVPMTYDNDISNAAPQNIDLYPVYADNSTPDAAIWVGPGPNRPVGDRWYATTAGGISSLSFMGMWNLPPNVAVIALCEAGCYTPEQEIRVGESFVSVAAAQKSGRRTLTTLAPNATMDALEYMKNTIGRWTMDIAPANQTIITLRMKSGGEMRVTTEHPLVTSEGVMKRAEDLIVGESLVREDGSPDPVVSMAKTTEFTKVYNLRPTTTDLTSNILVAQGYLTGSVRYQNEWVKYLNRVLLRHTILPTAIARSVQVSERATTTLDPT
jgi:hypothetical protein